MSPIGIQKILSDPCEIGLHQFRIGLSQISLVKKIKYYTVGCLLLAPIVNTIVHLVIEIFFPNFLRQKHLHDPLFPQNSPPIEIPKTQIKTKRPPKIFTESKPKTINDLSNDHLNKIFSCLNVQDLGKVAQVSKKFNSVQCSVSVWKEWLEKYSIPLVKDENPYQKAIKLLQYFKVDLSNKSLTIIRKAKTGNSSPENIKDALAVFPFPAWAMQPTSDPDVFNFYFKNQLNQVVQYRDVDKRNFYTARLINANKIMTDHQLVKLKLE